MALIFCRRHLTTVSLLWFFPATPTASGGAAPSKRLAVFTLVRGGSSEADYNSFVNSRRCLHETMPAWLVYDSIVFHEGNVPIEAQQMIRRSV
eukprot:5612513-Prymnesium_polylepis.2